MSDTAKQQMLEQIPPMTTLLKHQAVVGWLQLHPSAVVTDCLRRATSWAREQILDSDGEEGIAQVARIERVLDKAQALLTQATTPQVHQAINATGIILHTGLGRAVFPAVVVEAIEPALKGCVTLGIDRDTGDRLERDELIEPLLIELTGAEAATVVNNNAAATLLVLAALAAQKEVIVSRGQLVEIGGSFRLPEVMSQSQARLVEVGATNRTHLADYANAVTPNTVAIMRVHPSNYRVVGFTSEVPVPALAELAHNRGLLLIDDLGAGALIPLTAFGLPDEPTVGQSIEAGADVVLFSGDKLIGASQCGIIVGRRDCIQRLRRHPLMRAIRVDKTCLMVLERTLQLFRRPELLVQHHPTYRMLATPMEKLKARAQALLKAISESGAKLQATVAQSTAYLGSGTLPDQAIPSLVIKVSRPHLSAAAFSRKLRLDEACVFGRIEEETLCLDMRTITDDQVPAIGAALSRAAQS